MSQGADGILLPGHENDFTILKLFNVIYEVLNFLKGRLTNFISENRKGGEPLLVLSNPWSANDTNQRSANFLNALTVINIEEERVFKTQVPPIIKQGNVYLRKEPDIKLNLYVLVSAYNKNYEEALKFISRVIQFFQQHSVFVRADPPSKKDKDFPENCERIVAELYSASFEQQNQIWASMSTGYMPSVIYKIRTIIVEGDVEPEEHPLIQTRKFNMKDRKGKPMETITVIGKPPDP
jgi:hypothetical protein